MKCLVFLLLAFFCFADIYAQQDSVKSDTVKVVVQDSTLQDSVKKKSKLDIYLEAGREILAPQTVGQDSVISSVLPGDNA